MSPTHEHPVNPAKSLLGSVPRSLLRYGVDFVSFMDTPQLAAGLFIRKGLEWTVKKALELQFQYRNGDSKRWAGDSELEWQQGWVWENFKRKLLSRAMRGKGA